MTVGPSDQFIRKNSNRCFSETIAFAMATKIIEPVLKGYS